MSSPFLFPHRLKRSRIHVVSLHRILLVLVVVLVFGTIQSDANSSIWMFGREIEIPDAAWQPVEEGYTPNRVGNGFGNRLHTASDDAPPPPSEEKEVESRIKSDEKFASVLSSSFKPFRSSLNDRDSLEAEGENDNDIGKAEFTVISLVEDADFCSAMRFVSQSSVQEEAFITEKIEDEEESLIEQLSAEIESPNEDDPVEETQVDSVEISTMHGEGEGDESATKVSIGGKEQDEILIETSANDNTTAPITVEEIEEMENTIVDDDTVVEDGNDGDREEEGDSGKKEHPKQTDGITEFDENESEDEDEQHSDRMSCEGEENIEKPKPSSKQEENDPKEHPPSSPSSPSERTFQQAPLKHRMNLASALCGARIITSSPHTEAASKVLDSVGGSSSASLLWKCGKKYEKWVVIKLCEDIRVDTIELGNLEFFSSNFANISFHGGIQSSPQSWNKLGSFTAPDARSAHVFNLTPPRWLRYLKVEIDSVYGNEYYCPLTFVRVFGISVVEEYHETFNNPRENGSLPLHIKPDDNPSRSTTEIGGENSISDSNDAIVTDFLDTFLPSSSSSSSGFTHIPSKLPTASTISILNINIPPVNDLPITAVDDNNNEGDESGTSNPFISLARQLSAVSIQVTTLKTILFSSLANASESISFLHNNTESLAGDVGRLSQSWDSQWEWFEVKQSRQRELFERYLGNLKTSLERYVLVGAVVLSLFSWVVGATCVLAGVVVGRWIIEFRTKRIQYDSDADNNNYNVAINAQQEEKLKTKHVTYSPEIDSVMRFRERREADSGNSSLIARPNQKILLDANSEDDADYYLVEKSDVDDFDDDGMPDNDDGMDAISRDRRLGGHRKHKSIDLSSLGGILSTAGFHNNHRRHHYHAPTSYTASVSTKMGFDPPPPYSGMRSAPSSPPMRFSTRSDVINGGGGDLDEDANSLDTEMSRTLNTASDPFLDLDDDDSANKEEEEGGLMGGNDIDISTLSAPASIYASPEDPLSPSTFVELEKEQEPEPAEVGGRR